MNEHNFQVNKTLLDPDGVSETKRIDGDPIAFFLLDAPKPSGLIEEVAGRESQVRRRGLSA